MLKFACSRGRRKSQSIISTSAPVCASMNAVLMAVVVLPSDGWLEVIKMVLGGLPADESNSEVRRCRYASAIGERTSVTSARAVEGLGAEGSTWPGNLPFSVRAA